jgi:hypothetical protein
MWITNGEFRFSRDGFEKLGPLYSPENLRREESSVKKQLLEKRYGRWKEQIMKGDTATCL